MKYPINNLSELATVLSNLSPEQLKEPARVLTRGADYDNQVVMVEITEEAFYEGKTNDGGGYLSEIQSLPDFDLNDYDMVEPVGTVFLYVDSPGR
jgi:hypothetical protein